MLSTMRCAHAARSRPEPEPSQGRESVPGYDYCYDYYDYYYCYYRYYLGTTSNPRDKQTA